jgi:hypothetical protein
MLGLNKLALPGVRVRHRATPDDPDERISVAADRKTNGVQARQRRLENLAPTRNKLVAEDLRRCQIFRRHRGHHGPAKPRRLIGPVTQIRA